MKQIKELLMVEGTHALVLVTDPRQTKTIMDCVLQDIIDGEGQGWRGTELIRSQLVIRNQMLDSFVTFYVVRDPKEVKEHLSGLSITNILYTHGVTGDVLHSLKPLMRGANFKGIFSIEPVWWEAN